MSERFTVSGSTLSLLNVGEQGVVTRVTSVDQTIVQTLVAMGVIPGAVITLEQRLSQYRISVDEHQFIIGHETAQAIYVRLVEALPMPQVRPIPVIAQMTANLLKGIALRSAHSVSRHGAPSQSAVP